MAQKSHRLTLRFNDEEMERIKYWASQRDMSITEYMEHAARLAIRFEVGDYPLTTMEQARLNQLVERMASMESSVNTLSNVVHSTNETMISLARGDNYLEDTDGEL